MLGLRCGLHLALPRRHRLFASRVWPRQAANQESSGASRPSALRGLARCQARPRAARSTRGPSRSLQTCRRDAGARQVMATDGNRLVCGIQRTRCAAPHTRCTLAGAGARDLAHPLLMSRKAIADDRQETRDRPNPRSARPRRWTLWRLAVETHCFCRCAAGAWRFGRSHRPREGRRPGRRSSL